ncbi:MAG: hypothetical protein ACI4Q4_07345 [Oscillospiraceae bacterium]
MKISAIIAALFAALLMLTGTPARAEGVEYDYGEDKLYEAVPQQTRELLEDNGITPDNNGILGINLSDGLSALWNMVLENAGAPLRLLSALLGVVLLCALAEGIFDGADSSLKGTYSAVAVLAGAGIAVTAMSKVISDTLTLLTQAASFMLAFIPVFTAVAAALGHITAASAVNAAALAATQLFSQLAVNYLAPFCGVIMGLSVTGAIHPQLELTRLAELIRKAVVWGLSLIMTVFMSILSAQTFVANASDNTLIRTAKFMVSSGVPIVGGTISDAVNTVQGGLVLLKSSIGTYGLIAAAAIILPPLVTAVLYKLAAACAEAASDMFGIKELSALFRCCNSVMAIIIAVISCFLLLNTIAVVILLAMTRA